MKAERPESIEMSSGRYRIFVHTTIIPGAKLVVINDTIFSKEKAKQLLKWLQQAVKWQEEK